MPDDYINYLNSKLGNYLYYEYLVFVVQGTVPTDFTLGHTQTNPGKFISQVGSTGNENRDLHIQYPAQTVR